MSRGFDMCSKSWETSKTTTFTPISKGIFWPGLVSSSIPLQRTWEVRSRDENLPAEVSGSQWMQATRKSRECKDRVQYLMSVVLGERRWQLEGPVGMQQLVSCASLTKGSLKSTQEDVWVEWIGKPGAYSSHRNAHLHRGKYLRGD